MSIETFISYYGTCALSTAFGLVVTSILVQLKGGLGLVPLQVAVLSMLWPITWVAVMSAAFRHDP